MLLTIGQVAQRAGLRPSAIRFYEKSGLLPAPIRDCGQRRYDLRIPERIAVLRRAKQCGLTPEQARRILLGDGPPGERWRSGAQEKIAQLEAVEERIAHMKDLLGRSCHCVDLGECGRRILLRDNSV
jgi:MerR family transcriptional regulator, redox-sensitive transcriptional activator SoxR